MHSETAEGLAKLQGKPLDTLDNHEVLHANLGLFSMRVGLVANTKQVTANSNKSPEM